MQTWLWYKMPFSPNPFLPLHNIQRRFDFLGTQTRYFTGKHIRFGRSFTSQGARCSPHSCDEQKAVTSPRRCIFNAPAPNGGSVEICLKLSHIFSGGIGERRQCAAFLPFSQFLR